MRLVAWAICSLGVWVFLNSFVAASWDDIVFGVIAALLAATGALTIKQ